ncbi:MULTISPECIES: hypothetical protein [Serratia]|uniref:hypothetical protein n=1 Tax=Serratia TaxID=613 RepID=UPI0011C96F28|nr:hypothetical protein [Serratia bockelmannii]TXE46455.1 hypothetical protein FOT55_24755 [Serratia bockelmannii]BEN27045.1 hypothetical protein SMKC032_31400 [Serratia marcescens]BEO86394.1 hypothetical protein SMETW2_26440 [Serratia marcescens]
MAKVIFNDTGIEEEHEIDFEVRAGQAITLIRDGVSKKYIVDIVSGPIYESTCHPTLIRVRET